MKKYLLSFGLLFLSLLAIAQDASDVPPRPNPPRLVNDLADMLQPQEEQQLERKLVNYNDTTSTQVAIVTITSLGPFDVAAYAYRLGETWGIGGKGKNNGILILVAKNERAINISTGYGMEGVVPDAHASRIIEQIIKPAFRQNNYYGGLNAATDQIFRLASGEYQAEPKDYDDSGSSPLLFWLIIGLLVLFILSRMFGGGRGGRGGGMRTLMNPYGGFGTFGDFSHGRGPFGGWGGGGGFGGGGGGGGFGGFGGGSFGGGGASGNW